MVRIGVDLGGTKILVAAIDANGEVLITRRSPTPRDSYSATLLLIKELVLEIEAELEITARVGIGIPGSVVPSSGLIQNANSTWLNDRPLPLDLSTALDRDVRIANDANCFALSEAVDGAGEGFVSVFCVILGTGVGGGLVSRGELIDGPRSTGGEWGHCSLPFPALNERDGVMCWCGKQGCIESWISGPALTAQYNNLAQILAENVEDIVARATRGEQIAISVLNSHTERTARALSLVLTIFDPDVIVLGGGLSELGHLYDELPNLMFPFIFSSEKSVDIRRPKFGATSGVRGAARLWPLLSSQ